MKGGGLNYLLSGGPGFAKRVVKYIWAKALSGSEAPLFKGGN